MHSYLDYRSNYFGYLTTFTSMSSDRLARYVPAVQLFAARLVLFHQKVADRLGLTATEFKCFRLVELLGPLSLTALAEEAGLQLGTVSGLIDKLEANGFVRRQRDAIDKRRLVLVARSDAAARASVLYKRQGEAMAAFLESYSEREFDLLMTFLNEVGEILARSQSLLTKDQSQQIDRHH
jgi:DNA-binding MarR family transcriptional regulator